ncbi:hypothetical protein C6P46_000157 [Rhodotorula mucilaginosa]|uniref:NAD(P)-binding protein n=1 Tax=Rhodotorula mucilaginosa TaxID=5537 RepID=A0A9P6W8I4_RHOMI|nr:hypothetical protein C6P46_000157 [Rhodotorula mucilaginosa]
MTSLLRSLASKAGFSNGRDWQPETGLADLTGKVAAVTGANEGIGFITARELHKKGCKVFLLCRNEEKAQDAIKRINEATPGQPDNLVFIPFDLTDIPSAKRAADAISNQVSRLDILVNNAGIMAWPYELKNGIEVQFSNHTGHFALTKHLLPLLVKTSKQPGSSVRIVNVSSMGTLSLALFPRAGTDPAWAARSAQVQSEAGLFKPRGCQQGDEVDLGAGPAHDLFRSSVPRLKANILFSVALQDRLKDEKIYVNSLHPGNINTTLTRGPAASYGRVVGMMQPLWNLFGMTPFEGAKTQLYLAGSPEVEEKNYRAMYFVPIATPASTTAYAQDKELAEQLWKLSEDIVAQA